MEGLSLDREFTVANIKPKLGKCELQIFEVLLAHPDDQFTLEELAQATPSNYSPGSSGFKNSVSALSSLGALVRVNGRIKLSDDVKELL